MIKSFITSFQLKNTYRVNSVIYSIKQLPIIRPFLPDRLYENKGLKIIGNIVSILIEIISIFLGKLFYMMFMIFYVATTISKENSANAFIHIFIILTLIGGLLNTYMFNPTKDKYYAIMMMNMNAKQYTLSNYFYSLMKVVAGFLPFTILFGCLLNVPLYICLLMPLFVGMVKMTVGAHYLYKFDKYKVAKNENIQSKTTWLLVAILLLIAYGLPLLKISINSVLFLVTFVIFAIAGLISFLRINNFTKYKQIYKQLLTQENVYLLQNQTGSKAIKENASKQIVLDDKFTSNKTGFAYFHDLFIKRHKRILTEAVKKQTIVILLIVFITIVTVCVNERIAQQVNKILLTWLPYFVFIMYLLNRGTTVTQAMFMNCDHSMLTYRIYRTPTVILGLFKERLKTLIKVNMIPSILIALALPILLFLTGGTNNYLNYIVLFISIIAMSIFFSVHYLVMYYLLQPYNVNTEMKSSTYKVVQSITYFGCYYMIQLKLPTVLFGIIMSIFCILYSILSLVIITKYAPRTFKLRQ